MGARSAVMTSERLATTKVGTLDGSGRLSQQGRHSPTDTRVTVGASAYGVVPDTVVAYRAMVEKPDGDDDHDAQRHPGRDAV